MAAARRGRVTPAQRLTEARRAAGLSQLATARRIAEATGGDVQAARQSLRRWETGEREPGAESLAAWARALGVPVPGGGPLSETFDVVLAASALIDVLRDEDVPAGKRRALRLLRQAVERMEG
jgi:transcriptional regulator with XRE-family HTH domain